MPLRSTNSHSTITNGKILMEIGMAITNLAMMLTAAPTYLGILQQIGMVAQIRMAILILTQLLIGVVYLKADIVKLTDFH